MLQGKGDPVSSIRQLVCKRIEERLDPLDDFALPTIAAEITEEIKADKALLDAYVQETLPRTVYDEAMGVLSRQRLRYQQSKLVTMVVDEPPPPASSILGRIGTRRRPRRDDSLRWLRHTEYVKDHHVRIMALKKEEIPDAIAARVRRRDAEDADIKLLRECDRVLLAGEAIGDRHTADRLEEIYQAIRQGQPIPPPPKDDDQQQAV